MPSKYKDGLTGKSHTEQELLEMAEKHLAHNYAPPDKIFVRGNGVRVYDMGGREYFDLNACYSALPFGHKQGELVTFPRAFHTPDRILFAKELADFCGMDMICPMNTGAEAVETAIKLARKWGYVVKGVPKNRAEIIVCENNFHGRTETIISFSTNLQYKDLFGPHTPGFKIIPFGNVKALKDTITTNTVAFLVEPIQGEGGIIIPPEGYLAAIAEICKKNNVLLIFDEIQTGFGRTGDRFAFDHENTVPDVLILGKALGGGECDISAVVSTEEIMGLFKSGDHGSTFGGNPRACRSARKFLREFTDGNFDYTENSKIMGQYFLEGLQKIALKYHFIMRVRGRGLFIAIEFFYPNFDGAVQLSKRLLQEGLMTVIAKKHILRLSPPLNIQKVHINHFLKIFDKVLTT